jgi:hypothetical protein
VRLVTSDELQILGARWRVHEIIESDLHGVADGLLALGEDAAADDARPRQDAARSSGRPMRTV